MPTTAVNSIPPNAVLTGESRSSGHFVSPAQAKVTFVPARDDTTSGLSVSPMMDVPNTGFFIHDGKKRSSSAWVMFPTGVSEILPVWSVLMVSSVPATELGISCVEDSISAVMPLESCILRPPNMTVPGPRMMLCLVVPM